MPAKKPAEAGVRRNHQWDGPMKARTKTIRWLVVALLFGLVAAAGLALTYHHRVATLANATAVAPPAHTVLQPHAALLAAAGGAQSVPPEVPWTAESSYSNSQPPGTTTTRPDSHSNASAGNGGGSSSPSNDSTPGPVGAPQPQNHPATADTNHVPQAGAGDFANQIYAPLGCALPAGCGAVGGYVTRQTSGTSGGLPAVHNSQGSNSGNDGSPPPGNGSPQTNDSVQNPPEQGSNPPGKGSDPPTVSAPELDPATLAGALTLLLGALAILRGRRPARAGR